MNESRERQHDHSFIEPENLPAEAPRSEIVSGVRDDHPDYVELEAWVEDINGLLSQPLPERGDNS